VATLNDFMRLPCDGNADSMREFCVGTGSNVVKAAWVALRLRHGLQVATADELLRDRT
jgi:hypothetical protein